MGAAIQDHVDRVVAALSKKLHYPFGLLEAEVKVIIESALAHDVLNLSSYIYIYIYITETFEVFTIFHISTINKIKKLKTLLTKILERFTLKLKYKKDSRKDSKKKRERLML